MPSERDNKTYRSSLYDNEAAANSLFGFTVPVPDAPAPAPAPQPETAEPVLPVTEPVPEARPSVPLSQAAMSMKIMSDEPAPSAPQPATQPIPAPAPQPELSDDPIIQDVSSYTPAPAREPYREPFRDVDPQPGYVSPLGGTISMDTPQQMYQQKAYQPDAQPTVQQRVAPDTSLGQGTYGYAQSEPQTFNYNYDALSQPQVNFKTFGQKTIAVHSPKGGTGKSSIAKELAWAFALGDVNGQRLKVLLVDADFENGDQASLFNVPTRPNVMGWINRMREDIQKTGHIPRYDKMTISKFVIHVTENLDLLLAPNSQMDHKLIRPEMIRAICANLRSCDYDVIIYDNANSVDDETYPILEAVDKIFLVCTLDTTTLTEIENTLNTMRNRSFDLSKLSLVINKVPTEEKSVDIDPNEIIDTYELRFCTQILNDDKVRRNNNAADVAMLEAKDTNFSKAIKTMANEVIPIYAEKKKGFFSKLFGKK